MVYMPSSYVLLFAITLLSAALHSFAAPLGYRRDVQARVAVDKSIFKPGTIIFRREEDHLFSPRDLVLATRFRRQGAINGLLAPTNDGNSSDNRRDQPAIGTPDAGDVLDSLLASLGSGFGDAGDKDETKDADDGTKGGGKKPGDSDPLASLDSGNSTNAGADNSLVNGGEDKDADTIEGLLAELANGDKEGDKKVDDDKDLGDDKGKDDDIVGGDDKEGDDKESNDKEGDDKEGDDKEEDDKQGDDKKEGDEKEDEDKKQGEDKKDEGKKEESDKEGTDKKEDGVTEDDDKEDNEVSDDTEVGDNETRRDLSLGANPLTRPTSTSAFARPSNTGTFSGTTIVLSYGSSTIHHQPAKPTTTPAKPLTAPLLRTGNNKATTGDSGLGAIIDQLKNILKNGPNKSTPKPPSPGSKSPTIASAMNPPSKRPGSPGLTSLGGTTSGAVPPLDIGPPGPPRTPSLYLGDSQPLAPSFGRVSSSQPSIGGPPSNVGSYPFAPIFSGSTGASPGNNILPSLSGVPIKSVGRSASNHQAAPSVVDNKDPIAFLFGGVGTLISENLNTAPSAGGPSPSTGSTDPFASLFAGTNPLPASNQAGAPGVKSPPIPSTTNPLSPLFGGTPKPAEKPAAVPIATGQKPASPSAPRVSGSLSVSAALSTGVSMDKSKPTTGVSRKVLTTTAPATIIATPATVTTIPKSTAPATTAPPKRIKITIEKDL